MNTKVKKVVIPVMTMVIMASQLMGCASTSQSEMLKMINKGEQIEIVVEVSDFVEQGEESAITWETLDKLSTYDGFRLIMDSELGITCTTTKHGTIYINLDGQQEGNNTLYNALSNKAFAVTQFEDETIHENLRAAILDAYTDLEEADIDAAIFNAYFNLLPDSTPSYFNGGASLTRAEAMALLMRATTPVGELEDKWTDISALGEATSSNDYASYASYSDQFTFISTADKSLNEKTLNGTMTRGEFIYMVMDAIYGDVKADTTVTVNDCKDAGDIAKAQEFNGKDFCNSYTLQYALKNADAGAPTAIYNALTQAISNNIISADTAWDESITKADAILILVDTIKAFNNTNGYKVDAGIGETSAEVIETAKGYYNEHKADLNCTEQEFIDEYVARVESGLSEEEALNSVVLQFTPWDEDPGNNSDTDTDTTEPSTEDETTKPEDSETPETQAPTETPNNNNNNSSGNNNNNNNSSGGNTQEQQTPVTTQPAQTEPPKPAETTPVQTEPAKPAETTPPAVDNGNSNNNWSDPSDLNGDGVVTDQELAEVLGMTYEEYMEMMNNSADWEWN